MRQYLLLLACLVLSACGAKQPKTETVMTEAYYLMQLIQRDGDSDVACGGSVIFGEMIRIISLCEFGVGGTQMHLLVAQEYNSLIALVSKEVRPLPANTRLRASAVADNLRNVRFEVFCTEPNDCWDQFEATLPELIQMARNLE